MSTVLILAQAPANPVGPEFGKASPVGLAVILVLLVATVLLIRSMNKHLRKLPESFEPDQPEADQLADDGTDRGGVGRNGVQDGEPPRGRHRRPAADAPRGD